MSNPIYRKEEMIRPEGATSFIILSFSADDIYYKIKENLKKSFSEILFESISLTSWTPTPAEIGFSAEGNKARILSFKRRINREELPEMKEKCISITNYFSKIDPSIRIIPGYQTLYNTIIASSTDDFHKIYLFHGVYAEVVYRYESRQLQPVDSAPLFFTNKDVIYYFSNLREYYNQSIQIK
ncbi:MAG: DUF4416 family protein [Leptospiraceae bacterium]|nr:DUF4416 family protein [Leptospiraceae bacterium]